MKETNCTWISSSIGGGEKILLLENLKLLFLRLKRLKGFQLIEGYEAMIKRQL